MAVIKPTPRKKVNRGKDFEKQIETSLEDICSVERLKDPSGFYQGIGNICDFTVFSSPVLGYVECKSVYGDRFDFSNISDNQYLGLLKHSIHKDVSACVIVWFIDHDFTTLLPIEEIERIKNLDVKSLNIKKMSNVRHYPIDGIKQRVMVKYDGTSILNAMQKHVSEKGEVYGKEKANG